MRFEVVLTIQAERELIAATDWIARHSQSSSVAELWFKNLIRDLQSLERFPTRCGLARENDQFPYELRQLLCGRQKNFRAFFTLRDDRVVVISIRHSAQADLQPDDLMS